MAQPYVGEIRMFAGNFNPAGWEFCNGQLLSISENETLFQLIGTTYGGDGQSTFALPNLQSRIPIHNGNNAGANFTLSEMAGTESVTLTTQQLPVHSHPMIASGNPGSTSTPGNNFLAKSTSNTPYTQDTSTGIVNLRSSLISPVGGSQPHDNMQPFLCISYIISLYGIFPSQT